MKMKEAYVRGRKAGVPTDQGKMVRNGTPKTVDCGGASDGGGSADVSRAAKSINVGNRKGGAAGL